MIRQIPFTSVSLSDTFWASRMAVNRDVTLASCLDKCEQTGRIANFARAAGLAEGPHEGKFYNDSDVYKILEGVAYTLHTHFDSALKARADRVIDLIAAAQEESGYLNTYFQLARPGDKWTDMNLHEMYCGGHMIEAAIAYAQATGETKFLHTAVRFADHLDATFGPGKRHWVAGHQEIELALIKLYHYTGERKYLDLSLFLLGERGHGHGMREGSKEKWDKAYYQDTDPIEWSAQVMGHAVRGVYMYAAIADVVALTGNRGDELAINRLWESMVGRNYYIIGGIGQSAHNEGFTADFDLPNKSYCETCAAVAMVIWGARMGWLYGDTKYMDIVERSMYNNAIAGVSLKGDTFFYDNPLVSDGTYHRSPWFECSCCPSQLSRFIPSIGGYLYALEDDTLYINLYAQNRLVHGAWDVQVQGGYPYDGTIDILLAAVPENASLKLRIPGWCSGARIDGADYTVAKGYAVIHGVKAGQAIRLELPMPVRRNHAIAYVTENRGCVALSRGPMVYCVEQMDCDVPVEGFVVSDNDPLTLQAAAELPADTIAIGIHQDGRRIAQAVPYCLWDNRAPGAMRVWLKERIAPMELYK